MKLYALFANEIEQAWRDKARCKGLDPEIFFPGQGEDQEPAKSVCRECDVTVECLEYALRWNEKQGIWGGTSERERRRVMRRRAAEARRERERSTVAS